MVPRRRNRLWSPALRWLYDYLQAFWGGVPFPRRTRTLSPRQPAPVSNLNLQPGDLVRVKSYGDILATLDSANKNRGLFFDAELVPFCSREFRVKARLTNFIDEKTRKDGVAQDARRHSRERLVPITLQYLPCFLPKKHLIMVA